MSDFNPLQIITKIASNVISSRSIQTNAEPSAGSALNSTLSNLSQNFNSQFENSSTPAYFQPKPFIMSEESELKLTTIEVEKKADYVKDLLNLPKDFEELINQISTGTASSPVLSAKLANVMYFLTAGGKIDLSKLSEFLGENSKEAMQKLMMTIANISKYGANDVSNLKELMGLFSANVNITSDVQALKTLLLLYLPWLPLASRNENNLDFTIDIFDKIQGPDPDAQENIETVKILIQTENYGNVIVTLEMNPLGQVDIDVAANKDFPHKRVMELIKEEASINGVKSNVSSSFSKSADKKDAIDYPSNNVKITASGAISPKLVLMSQCLIKIIIQLDYEKSIIKKENAE